MPFLGHWEGGLDVVSSKPGTNIDAVRLGGYLQLYQTHEKYSLELSNRLQVMDVTGTWKIVTGDRIQLTPGSISFSEPDVTRLAALRRPFINPQELKSAYGRPMVLDLRSGTLNGLLVTVGPMEGRHSFHRPS